MSVRFSETLQRSREVLQAQPWCARLDSITIVRDVRGQIHLFLEGYRPNDQERSVLQEALAAPDALGPYWTGDVWLPSPDPRAPASALSDMISKQRSALPGWTSPPRWHILERHIAKQSWTERPSSPEPPWPVANVYSGVAPVIVAFFSFKGGLGRTTTAVATALVLAQFGHRVALIDLDLEAPGLASMFLGESDDRAGVIDYLIEKPVQRDDWHLRRVRALGHRATPDWRRGSSSAFAAGWKHRRGLSGKAVARRRSEPRGRTADGNPASTSSGATR